MASNPRDGNFKPTLRVALDVDGVTPVNVEADISTNRLLISDGSYGFDNGKRNAQRDADFFPVIMAVSATDGVTPVEVYADANGFLLTTSH